MARKSKLTPEVQERIVQAISMGATYELASQFGGIHYDTFNEWMKGKPDFSEAVKAAEGRAVVGWLAKIEKAASDGNWQAAAWKLERRYPENYGRTDHRLKIDVDTKQLEALARLAESKGLTLSDLIGAMSNELSAADNEQ